MDNSMFKSLFSKISLGIAILDDSSKILQANRLFFEYFDINKEDRIPNNIEEVHSIFIEKHLSAFQTKTKLILSNKITLTIKAEFFEDKYWFIEIDDISAQEKEKEDNYYKANYDQLTKLPNRELFNDRCKQAISSAHRHEDNLAILFIDLDNFKYINDTYGHDTGDSILLETANRLIDSVRESDTVSRWAGDEFCILLSKIGGKENINQLLSRLIQNFNLPQKINKNSIPVSLSIGISLAPEMSLDFSDLMKFADKAMYEAKKNQGNSYKYYIAK